MRSPYTAVICRGDDGCQNTSASAAPGPGERQRQHRRRRRRSATPSGAVGLARIHLGAATTSTAPPPLRWLSTFITRGTCRAPRQEVRLQNGGHPLERRFRIRLHRHRAHDCCIGIPPRCCREPAPSVTTPSSRSSRRAPQTWLACGVVTHLPVDIIWTRLPGDLRGLTGMGGDLMDPVAGCTASMREERGCPPMRGGTRGGDRGGAWWH